jgi:thiol-disulfide isomerase/thioredoxin
MKKIIVISVFLWVYASAFAQQNQYHIKGKIEGKSVFKNIFLFNNDFKVIGKHPIKDDQFNFSGNYFSEQISGEISIGIILFSNLDSITDKTLLYPGASFIRRVIMEPAIDVIYNTDLDQFTVKGGELNSLQNKFTDNEFFFKKKKDSAYFNIDSQLIDKKEKKNQKWVAKSKVDLAEKTESLNIIKQYPNSQVALFNFMPFAVFPFVPLKTSREVFQNFSTDVKNSKYGKRMIKMLNEQEAWQKVMMKTALQPGGQMPEFELVDSKGKLIKSTSVFGKYTLIDFWATWCIPCRQEIPRVKEVAEKYKSKGFNVMAISMDDEKDKYKWLAAIETEGIQSFINLFNPTGTPGIAKDLNINAIPANFLVDETGKVIAVNLRGDGLSKKMAELIK